MCRIGSIIVPHLDHTMGLVDGVEDVGVASVVRILHAVLLQRER